MLLSRFRTFFTLLILTCLCSQVLQAQQVNSEKYNTAKRRSTNATSTLTQVLALPADKSIPRELLDKAKAIAVFPDATQFNFFTQKGMKAYGLIARREGNEWTVPAFYRFSIVKYGLTLFKAGSPSVIILFMSDDSVQLLRKDLVEPTGQGGPIGESRPDLDRAGKTVLFYTFDDKGLGAIDVDKGLLLGIRIDSDNNINKVVYGLKAREVLWKSKPLPTNIPDEVTAFQRTLNELLMNKVSSF